MSQLDFKLTPAQSTIDAYSKRYTYVCAGRGFGKSMYGLYRLLKAAEKPNSKNWLVAPTGKQAKEILWEPLCNAIPPEFIRSKNATLMNIVLTNGAEIGLRGSEKDRYLRGVGLDFVIMDEAAFQKEFIWDMILRPQVMRRKGSALFITTPNGRNWFKKRYDAAMAEKDPESVSFHFTIYDNPHISKEEIDKIKIDCDELTWRQEYMAEFVEWVGLVYAEFDDKKNTCRMINDFPEHIGSRTFRGLDYGLDDFTACTWAQIKNNCVYISREYQAKGLPISSHVKNIQKAPFMMCGELDTCLDGVMFKTEGSSMQSIAQTFLKEGLRAVPAQRSVDVGTDIFRKFLVGDGEVPQLKIDSSCKNLINALKTWNYGEHEPDVLASARYLLWLIYRKRLINFPKDRKILSIQNETDIKIGLDKGPESILESYQNRLRKSATDNSWDYDAGCPL